jgi:hypothetical protein
MGGRPAHRQAAGHRARREPLTRCSPTERRFVDCPDLWAQRSISRSPPVAVAAWTVEETDALFTVHDANGQALAYVHFERELGDAQPRKGSPATRVLTCNAFVR